MLPTSCEPLLAAVIFCDQGCVDTSEISSQPRMIWLCYEGAAAPGGPVFVLPVDALCTRASRGWSSCGLCDTI